MALCLRWVSLHGCCQSPRANNAFQQRIVNGGILPWEQMAACGSRSRNLTYADRADKSPRTYHRVCRSYSILTTVRHCRRIRWRTVVYGTFRFSRLLNREGDDRWPVYGVRADCDPQFGCSIVPQGIASAAGRKPLVHRKHSKRNHEADTFGIYVLYHSNRKRRAIGDHRRCGWCALVWGVFKPTRLAGRCFG